MKAYNETDIRNQFIVTQAERWQRQQLLSDAQLAAVRKAYPVSFKSGNAFIDIGLFIFTIVAAGGGFGLLALAVGDLINNNQVAQGIVCLLVGIGAGYITTRFTQHGTYYRNGVDNALILISTAFLVAGTHLLLPSGKPLWLNCLINLPIMLGVIWYFGDLLITLAALIALYTMVFSGLLEVDFGKMVLPFVFMTVSVVLYNVALQFPKHTRSLYYTDSVTLTEWIALIVLVASGNYFVVRELNGLLLPDHSRDAPEIAFAYLFWALTFVIPGAYLGMGLQRKNRMLVILGSIGLMASVATVRAYYVWATLSVYMAICGSLLIIIAAWVIRYLNPAKNGFTDVPDDDSPKEFWGNAQTLAAMHGVSGTHPPDGVKFGGGDFGGGGAEGKY